MNHIIRTFHIMNVPDKGRGTHLNTSQIIAYKDRPKYILFSACPPLEPDTHYDIKYLKLQLFIL